MRKATLFFVAAGVLLAACELLPKTPPRPADDRPNVVVIYTDDQGWADIGTQGAVGFETPNLDRLAAEGTRFTDFYVAQPVCSASRTALLTGCYPNRLGIHGAIGPRNTHGIHDEETTIADLRRSAVWPKEGPPCDWPTPWRARPATKCRVAEGGRSAGWPKCRAAEDTPRAMCPRNSTKKVATTVGSQFTPPFIIPK